MVKSPIPFLRKLGLIEGTSLLVLMGIAMPLKYFAGQPMAVKITGWIHGILFIAFCVVLLRTMFVAKWPILRGALLFIAALVPFGPFLVDRRMHDYEREFQQRFRPAAPESVNR
jgi:integral membrane protein